MQEGDLQQALHDRQGEHLSEDEVLLCFVQLSMGMLHIHERVRHLSLCLLGIEAGPIVNRVLAFWTSLPLDLQILPCNICSCARHGLHL